MLASKDGRRPDQRTLQGDHGVALDRPGLIGDRPAEVNQRGL